MKIGIDAKWYFNGNPSGQVVVRNIVNEIVKIDSNVDFYIFLDKRDKHLKFPINLKNVHLYYVPNYINALTNIFILPFYTYYLKLDVCLYQNYCPVFGAKKTVGYIHDSLFMDFPQFFTLWERLYFFPIKYLAKTSNHIITISNSEKKRMIEHGFSRKENISVVYHGLGLADNTKSSSTNIFEKYKLPKRFILYVGRINIRKNIQSVLKAMESVDNNVSLVIVGENDHKSVNLDGLIKELNIEDRVIKVGYVETEDIGLFYSCAEVFCFPSFAEGFGLPPLEAMYFKTPVVVSNKTSLPEICGDAALYIDPNLPADIALKLNKVIRNNDVKEELVQKGYRRSQHFSWTKSATEILNILKSL